MVEMCVVGDADLLGAMCCYGLMMRTTSPLAVATSF